MLLKRLLPQAGLEAEAEAVGPVGEVEAGIVQQQQLQAGVVPVRVRARAHHLARKLTNLCKVLAFRNIFLVQYKILNTWILFCWGWGARNII